jgi:hypothetical protein
VMAPVLSNPEPIEAGIVQIFAVRITSRHKASHARWSALAQEHNIETSFDPRSHWLIRRRPFAKLLLKEGYMVHGKNVVQGNAELKRVGGERLGVLSAAQ